MENAFVSPDELSIKLRSKLDLYNILKYQLRYFLPSYRKCPVGFMKSILSGKKNAFKTSEILIFEVPGFVELSVKSLWPKWKANETILQYIPQYCEKELPERHFLFAIVGTLYQLEFSKLIEKAYEHRSKHQKEKQDELIELTPEIKDFLKSVITYKTSPGRALSLLKVKSVQKKTIKPRLAFPADLREFEVQPRRRVRRLNVQEGTNAVHRHSKRDANMEDEEQKEN